ncbi:hypothetical protein [Blastopirellula marina]|uniref:Uncharacterized protein n=1 Tax=Blastopirellula marina TaxID=124 RepID=A0A2S8GPP0_9BACT|nr:hypothetical protein [Blastopirellula marina]PQO46408.1 hypothetical protein C5Y93_10535 [Blastopirellula marina]
MANKKYGSLPDEELRELFLIGEGQASTSGAKWKLVTTPDSVQIEPKEIAWGFLMGVNSVILLLNVSAALMFFLYGKPHEKVPGSIVFLLTGVMIATLLPYFGWRKLRHQQRMGPWLLIDQNARTVTLPRHGITVPLEAVDHIQAISGSLYGGAYWPDEEGEESELNLIVREGEKRLRYPLMSAGGGATFTPLARTIAELDLMPVKRVQSNWEPLQIYETWMTPGGGSHRV